MKLHEILTEMEFNDYSPSVDELNAEIEQIKKSLMMAKEQGKQPMVAKYDLQLRQALKRRNAAQKQTPAE